MYEEYVQESADLKAQIAKAESNAPAAERDLAPLKQFLASDFRSAYEQLDAENRRRVWRNIIKEIIVEKKGKNGPTEQNIAPMIRRLTVQAVGTQEIVLRALICCQNPTLNPMQLGAAIEKYLPDLTPDFVHCRREEIYDTDEMIFR